MNEAQALHRQVRRVGSRLAIGSEGAYKVTFATLLIAAALGSTYVGSDGNFPRFELPGVVVRRNWHSAAFCSSWLSYFHGAGVSRTRRWRW